MPSTALTVPVEAPALPLILADSSFVEHLDAVEKMVSEIVVTDASSQQLAATVLNGLTKDAKQIEDQRVSLAAPFLAIQRAIMDAAKPVQTRITVIKSTLNQKLLAFQQAEAERARKAEAERQAELARLEKIRQKEEADRLAKEEADRKAAAALAAKLPAEDDNLDIPEDAPAPLPPTKVEQQIAAVRYAPAIAPARAAGIKYVVALKHEVLNAALLPREFQIISADDRKIRAMYCVGYKEGQPLPQVPGVRFVVEKNIAGTGR
jgi:hypothetical protein